MEGIQYLAPLLLPEAVEVVTQVLMAQVQVVLVAGEAQHPPLVSVVLAIHLLHQVLLTLMLCKEILVEPLQLMVVVAVAVVLLIPEHQQF
jgi:hypothetical protein